MSEEIKMISIDIPTVKEGMGWLICTTPLGCGSRILQGWSSGFGIAGNETSFETKLAKLLHWSIKAPELLDNHSVRGYIYTNYTINQHWGTCPVVGPAMAAIGVGRAKYQFLKPNWTYTLNSTEEWIDRFENFIKKYDLGQFSKSHAWVNYNYKQARNVTAVWTWNGKVPCLDEVGLKDWVDSPYNVKVKEDANSVAV